MISARHVEVITAIVAAVPADAEVDDRPVEAWLVHAARTFEPRTVRRLGRMILAGYSIDEHSKRQRWHDALRLLLRTGHLPASGGIATTLIRIGNETDWAAGSGYLTTGNGTVLPTSEPQSWVGSDTRAIHISSNQDGVTVDPQRLFSTRDRYALIARDRGCCFPGCDRPTPDRGPPRHRPRPLADPPRSRTAHWCAPTTTDTSENSAGT